MGIQDLDLVWLSFLCGLTSFIAVLMLLKSIFKKDNCTHKNTFMYVESVAATCEKVTTTCLDCGHKSTKTEC